MTTSPPPQNRRLPPTAAFVGISLTLGVFFLAAGAPTPLFAVFETEWGYPSSLSTVAFGVYAVALLAALLTVGGLSDYVGRRRVLLVAVGVELAAMLLFLTAQSIEAVIVARIVQGMATGAAASALTAWVVELAPSRHKSLASVVGGAASTAGLGLGALLSGTAVELTNSPSTTVFVALVVLVAAGFGIVALSSETVSATPGAAAALRPRISVPKELRSDFTALIPVQVAGWMYSALFIGLSPEIVRQIFHINDGLALGAVAFVAPAAAAIASVVLRAMPPRLTTILGSSVVLLGATLLLVGMIATTLPVFVVGGVVGGFGFGASFSGGLRALLARAEPRQRAGVSAALFVVAYLAFGIPAVIAGELIGKFGPLAVVLDYVIVIAVAALIGAFAQLRLRKREVSPQV